MSIVVGGTTIPTNGDYIKVGSTNVDKVDVVKNNVRTTVWKKETGLINPIYTWGTTATTNAYRRADWPELTASNYQTGTGIYHWISADISMITLNSSWTHLKCIVEAYSTAPPFLYNSISRWDDGYESIMMESREYYSSYAEITFLLELKRNGRSLVSFNIHVRPGTGTSGTFGLKLVGTYGVTQ